MSNHMYFMGIDVGTTTTKGILIEDNKKIIAKAEIAHGVSRPYPDWAEHDAESVWWKDFSTVCKKLLNDSEINGHDVAAVSVSALYPVIVPTDSDRRPLRPAILYGIDQRATKEIEYFKQRLGDSYSIEISANALCSQSIAPKILWIKNNEPEIFEKTSCFMYATTYLMYKLTGECIVDHASASLSGLPYNIKENRWDEKSCEVCGIETDKLPRLAWSGEKAGYVTKKAALETGLSETTLVVVGTSDHAAETLAMGGSRVGTPVISYGTTFGFDVCVDKMMVIDGLTVCSTGFPDKYLIGGAMSCGACLTKWFRDNFGLAELEIEKSCGINAYETLASEAERVPAGCDGLITLPYFAGERCPICDPYAAGILCGLTFRHTKAYIYRSLLEGVGFGIRHIMSVLRNSGVEFSDAIAVGGGTKASLWCSIISDITSLNQVVLREYNGSCLADAMIAALGYGYISSLEDCTGLNGINYIAEPNKNNQDIYEKYYQIFRELYQETSVLIKRLKS